MSIYFYELSWIFQMSLAKFDSLKVYKSYRLYCCYKIQIDVKYTNQINFSKMSSFLQFVCCCFYPGQTPAQITQTVNQQPRKKQKRPKPVPKPSRIVSKYRIHEVIEVQKSQRAKGKIVYTCPICTMYLNKILACDQCENHICRNCANSYEKKFQISSLNMKCPFCNSQTSNFIDYEQQAKSYFDTTGKNGFLDPVERNKIDQQMKWNGSKYLDNGQYGPPNKLQVIQQEALNNPLTFRNLQRLQNYNEIMVERRQQPGRNVQNNAEHHQIGHNEAEQSIQQLNRGPNGNGQNGNYQSDLNFIQQFEIRSPL